MAASHAGRTQRALDAEDTRSEDGLAILDRRLRDATRRDLGLGSRHVLPPSIENAVEDASLSAASRSRRTTCSPCRCAHAKKPTRR